jgi:hypothetical protein
MYDSQSETILRPVERMRRVSVSAQTLASLQLQPTRTSNRRRGTTFMASSCGAENYPTRREQACQRDVVREGSQSQPHLLEEQLGRVRQRDLDDVL